MRLVLCTLALTAALVAASAASAQGSAQPKTSGGSLPTFAAARLNMTSALGNIFGIRNLLPSFRDGGQVTGGVPGATLNGVPDPSNSANYLKGFGYKRLQ